jgi:hypothetical protein
MQGAQLDPGDLRMDAAAQVAAGSGDDVFSADDFAKARMRSPTGSGCSTMSVVWASDNGWEWVGPCYVCVVQPFSFHKNVFSSLRGSVSLVKLPS